MNRMDLASIFWVVVSVFILFQMMQHFVGDSKHNDVDSSGKVEIIIYATFWYSSMISSPIHHVSVL